MSGRIVVDRYETVEHRSGDTTRSTHHHTYTTHAHPDEVVNGGEEMQTLKQNLKKFSFPADDYTKIEMEQEQRRKSSFDRQKKSCHPSAELRGIEGDDMRGGRRSREYVLKVDDDDEDNFMILSTRENRDNIMYKDTQGYSSQGRNASEHSILNDELKHSGRQTVQQQQQQREEYPITMVPICDIDYLSSQQPAPIDDVDSKAFLRHQGMQDLTQVREFAEEVFEKHENFSQQTERKQKTSVSAKDRRKSSDASSKGMFMSKNEVRDLLREFNEDYRRNTDLLIKEMKESTSSLVKNFQETVTFSFREITSTLKEMEEQNTRLNIKNNDVLSEDVELLYNKIMEDNQEIKSLVAGLVETPINRKVTCEECEQKEMESSKKVTKELGPEECIPGVQVKFDKVPGEPSCPNLDEYVCEIVVCPGTQICVDEKLEDTTMIQKTICTSDPLELQTQLKNEINMIETRRKKSSCSKPVVMCEVKEKIEEINKQKKVEKVEKKVVEKKVEKKIEKKVEKVANKEEDWFNSLRSIKSIHQNVHFM